MPPRGPRGPAAVPKSYGKSYRRPKRARPPKKTTGKKPTLDQALRGVLDDAKKPKLVDRDVKVRKPRYNAQGKKVGTVTKTVRMPNQGAANRKRARIYERDQVEKGVRAENMLLTDKGVDRRTRHEVPLVRAKLGLKNAMRDLGKIERVEFKAPKPKGKSIGGFLENAGRNLKDAVVGAVPSAIELGKAGVEEGRNALQSVGTAGRVKGTRDGVKPIKEGIKREDPLYALAEAGVRAVKGDGEGARRSLRRAADKAYERPLDAASYAAAGGGAASRGATAARYAGKGGTAAATARPSLKASNGTRSTSSPAKVRQQRDAAQAEVRERQRATGGERKAGKVDRDQDVQAIQRAPERDTTGAQREQRYAKGAVGRTIQKKRENRKAAKGQDPFEATGRRAKRMQARRFDEQSRNVHAGGLAREGVAEKEGREHAKRVRDPKGRVMVQLLANQRVRPESAKADVAALRAQAAKGDLPSDKDNVRILDDLAADAERLAADPKLKAEAEQRAAELRESEGRAKREGFFRQRDGGEAAPEFVAAMQPHLARGEIERVGGGDGPERHAPVGRSGPDTPQEPPAARDATEGGSSTPPPATPDVQAQRRAAIKSTRRKLKKIDAEISAIVMRERQAPTYTKKAGETEAQAAARAIEQGGQSAGRSGKLSGQAASGPGGKTRVEIRGEKAGRERTRVARKVPVDADRARLVELRAQRQALQDKHDQIMVAGQHDARKASALDVATGPGGTRAVRGDRRGDGVRVAAVERDQADDHGEQHHGNRDLNADAARVTDVVDDADTSTPVVRAPSHAVEVAHGKGASTTRGAPRNGTSVRSPAGYRWTTGPRKGQMVKPEDFDDGANQTFIRGLERDGDPSDVLRQPHAGQGYSPQDAISGRLDDDRILETQLDRERQITLIRLARGVEESFAYTSGGRRRFGPADAQRIAKQLSGPGEKWTAMPVDDGKQYIVVRKVIADRWAQQIGRPGRTERALRFATRQFVRTVLPWSTSWHMGNTADLFTRLVVEDPALISAVARGRSQELFAHLEQAMGDLDPHLRRELIDTLQGHFGARATIEPKRFTDITDDAKLPLIRAAGEAISATRQLPGIRQTGDAVAGATDAAFDFGIAAESRLVHTAAGAALENYARALGIETADHARLAEQMAREFKDDPAKILEFQRRTLEITGDYITRSPIMRKLGNMGVPFINWIRAANRFVFLTLPRQHPYKVALGMWAAAITAEERAQLGLNYYLTDDEIERRGLPERQTMANAGGIVLNSGQVIATAPMTSLGEAAKWLELGDEAVSGHMGSAAAGVGEGTAALVARPIKAAVNQDAEVAASRAIEGFVPGPAQVRKAIEGDRPHPYSTFWDPIGTGNKKLTDRVLSAISAPQPRSPYGQSKTKKERAEAAVGTTRTFIIGGPGGRKRAKRVLKTKP